MNPEEIFSIAENFYENSEYSNSELVIGFVGAIGSRLNTLTDILSVFLRNEFQYEVEVIKVSSDIIFKYLDEEQKKFTGYDKYSSLIHKGNDLRRDNGVKYLALEIAAKISQKRKEREENSKSKRVVYIINSLKHDQEIKALRQIYSHGFFQVSLY